MEEKKIKRKLCSEMKKRGWFVRLIIRTSTPGDPDCYFYKNHRVIWIETKKAGKDARPLQEYRHKEIRESGQECYTVSGQDELKQFLSTL